MNAHCSYNVDLDLIYVVISSFRTRRDVGLRQLREIAFRGKAGLHFVHLGLHNWIGGGRFFFSFSCSHFLFLFARSGRMTPKKTRKSNFRCSDKYREVGAYLDRGFGTSRVRHVVLQYSSLPRSLDTRDFRTNGTILRGLFLSKKKRKNIM